MRHNSKGQSFKIKPQHCIPPEKVEVPDDQNEISFGGKSSPLFCPDQVYIGPDWEEVSITSDPSENRRWYSQGHEYHYCQFCGRRFRDRMLLNSHELFHAHLELFQCPVKGCKCAYPTAKVLKSHVRKKHPKGFSAFEAALKEA